MTDKHVYRGRYRSTVAADRFLPASEYNHDLLQSAEWCPASSQGLHTLAVLVCSLACLKRHPAPSTALVINCPGRVLRVKMQYSLLPVLTGPVASARYSRVYPRHAIEGLLRLLSPRLELEPQAPNTSRRLEHFLTSRLPSNPKQPTPLPYPQSGAGASIHIQARSFGSLAAWHRQNSFSRPACSPEVVEGTAAMSQKRHRKAFRCYSSLGIAAPSPSKLDAIMKLSETQDLDSDAIFTLWQQCAPDVTL